MRIVIGSLISIFALAACSDTAGPRAPSPSPAGDAGASAAQSADVFNSGFPLRVAIPEKGRARVSLDARAVLPEGDSSAAWDIAFEGLDVFTNSGPSGGGAAGVFGPLDASTFALDASPEVPFLAPDKAGGAFLDWYAYEGAPAHAIWSRYHVLAVKDGARVWKVQVLGYYGERDGAPVSGLYRVRYAELLEGGSGPAVELVNVDGTAGGPQALPTVASECLDLASGARVMLTPDAARASSDWHLCFRRQSIGVNGESSGLRGVGAVDLGSAATSKETVDTVKARTADSERAAFDAVTLADTRDRTFRGDHVVSGFGDAWVDRGATPVAPARAAWLVAGAGGRQRYFVGFESFEGATSSSPGTVVMRIKPIKG